LWNEICLSDFNIYVSIFCVLDKKHDASFHAHSGLDINSLALPRADSDSHAARLVLAKV